jgi:hypothetical protein
LECKNRFRLSRRSSRPGTPTRRTRAPQARSSRSSSQRITARTSFASAAIPPAPRTAPNGEPWEGWRLSRDACDTPRDLRLTLPGAHFNCDPWRS